MRKKESAGSIASLSTEISAIDIELTKMEGNLNMALSEKERFETGITGHIRRAEEMESEIASSIEKKKRLEAEIERLESEIHTSLARKEDIGTKSQNLMETIENVRGDISEKEDMLKKSEGALDFTKDALSNARIKFAEATGSIRNLTEKIEEHSLTIEDANNYDASELDMDECRARLSELKDTFSKIGDVNLAAIDDYNQVAERLSFLTTQRDDLLESINDITKVIDKLNRKTKRLFEETFQKVRENFQIVFKRLFHGGEADMVLTDESNILESGIEIMIRPPGKKRQNITLLSAGEKAMTAVSILFSVFMVMPSPFCLLDEVDAPLDESNIGRFKDILKDFSKTTQFLVITHNQKTMAFADRLYGITMQQPGISQVLSVDMIDTDSVPPEELHAVTA
jgi:chromosome segregation protein